MAKIAKKIAKVKTVKSTGKAGTSTGKAGTIAKGPAKAAPKKVAARKIAPPAKPAQAPEKPAEKPKVAGPDTGSAHVQINFMTGRIEELIVHLRVHPKDFDSKRGLLMIVGKRRRLLNYLARKEPAEYEKITAKLKLAKTKAPARPAQAPA